jgi:hypothetical protein
MPRRADPERIHQARRIAVRNGLTDYGMSLEDAERWCDAWEAEAERLAVPKDARLLDGRLRLDRRAARAAQEALLSGAPETTAGGTINSEAPRQGTNQTRSR